LMTAKRESRAENGVPADRQKSWKEGLLTSMGRKRTGGEMTKESRKRYRQRRHFRLQTETLRGMKESREAIATL
jgi:hypothetical protein